MKLFPKRPARITRLTRVDYPTMKWYRLDSHESVGVPRHRHYTPKVTVCGGTNITVTRSTAARLLREMRKA